MKLEAVIICSKYHDFLAESLPLNKAAFDKLVVVTDHEDRATQRLCEYWHVQCVQTDALQSRKGLFCKGAGINTGLAALDCDGWLLHLDADIVLPPLFRPTLENLEKDQRCIYGCDRFMVRSHADWARFREMPRLMHENGSWLHLGSFPLGTRVSIPQYGGYVPIGFFQLWHSSVTKAYPEGHKTAAREDTQFALEWTRARRVFVPELVVYHLESEHAPMASNWSGRQTLPFTHDQRHRDVCAPNEHYLAIQRRTGCEEREECNGYE